MLRPQGSIVSPFGITKLPWHYGFSARWKRFFSMGINLHIVRRTVRRNEEMLCDCSGLLLGVGIIKSATVFIKTATVLIKTVFQTSLHYSYVRNIVQNHFNTTVFVVCALAFYSMVSKLRIHRSDQYF